MAIKILTRGVAEVFQTAELGDSHLYLFDVSPLAPQRRTSWHCFAPQAPIRAQYSELVAEDFEHGTFDAFAKTPGKDLLVHCEVTDTPLQVAVGECSTQGGTYAYSAWVDMNDGDALRVNVSAAFWKLKVRKRNSEATGRATLVHQEVPAAVWS